MTEGYGSQRPVFHHDGNFSAIPAHYENMRCDGIREAISARIDGEDPGLPAGTLDAHLAVCEACRGWQQQAHAVTRRARLGGPFLDRDLAPQVAAVSPAFAGRRRRLTQRTALATAAAAQLVITVPLLVLGHDHDAGVHAAHELGSFNLALAIAFAVGAVRPALSAGLAWACGIAAAGLTVTAIVDLFAGQTLGADEAQHLIAVAGAALLVWQACTYRAEAADAARAAGQDLARVYSAVGAEAAVRADRPPDPPGGGEAARATGPVAVGEASDRGQAVA
jgi:predicted anti-sigma-YlaC factor YlaD